MRGGAPNRVGLAVAGATLELATSSATSAIVDELAVPVVATVTTTPSAPPPAPSAPPPGQVAVRSTAADRSVAIRRGEQSVIGGGGNAPSAPPAPSAVQLALTASIPREALAGTGIIDVELGKSDYQVQALGAGATLASAAPMTVNLTAAAGDAAPYQLQLANLGLSLTSGVSYVLAIANHTLTARGSDGSTA